MVGGRLAIFGYIVNGFWRELGCGEIYLGRFPRDAKKQLKHG
jgi:hypothetical protein